MSMWVPRAFGGAELGPTRSIEVVEALSYADGSTGWVQMATGLSTGTGAAYLAPEVAAELFGDRLSLIATGQPEFRIFVVPVADALLTADWDTLGLRATGSIDYSIAEVFVPGGRTHLQHTKTAVTGGELYRLGILGDHRRPRSGWVRLHVRRWPRHTAQHYPTQRPRHDDRGPARHHFASDFARMREGLLGIAEGRTWTMRALVDPV